MSTEYIWKKKIRNMPILKRKLFLVIIYLLAYITIFSKSMEEKEATVQFSFVLPLTSSIKAPKHTYKVSLNLLTGILKCLLYGFSIFSLQKIKIKQLTTKCTMDNKFTLLIIVCLLKCAIVPF